MTSDCDTRNDSYIGCYMNKSAAHLMYKAVTYSRKALWIDKTSRYAFPCECIILWVRKFKL